MPYIYQEPEVFMEYRGVKVYHVYKDSGTPYMKQLGYWYTLDKEERSNYEFDIRDVADAAKLPKLGSERENEWFQRVLCRVLRSTEPLNYGVLFPDGVEVEEPDKFDPEFSHDVVKTLEGMEIESFQLDELVHECKGNEAAAINNSGMLEQVDYLLRNGVSWEDLKDQLNLYQE